MLTPKRLACLAIGANTRTLIAKDKVMGKHPQTGAQLVVEPTVFISFMGTRTLFLDDQNVKCYGFEDLAAFLKWFLKRGELEKGEIVFSACLEGKLRPVSDMGKDDVDRELRQRILLGEKEVIEGTSEEKAASLLELRRIAGEGVPEPRPIAREPEVAVTVPSEDAAALTDGILGKFAAGRR